jgi:hypothetical protein
VTRSAATRAATAEERGVIVDTPSNPGEPVAEEPPYRLPSPLPQQGRGLPVSPTAPRIPRALRAFNGMAPGADPAPAEPARPAARSRGREPQRSIRDLLLDTPEPPDDSGLIGGLRSAWRRLRRPELDDQDGNGT